MIKSKHSGWTWDLRRTPFGGGGGIIDSVSNVISSVGNTISDVGNVIDKSVTQPVGNAFAQADKFMTNLTPYGWALPAAIVAAYFTGGGSLAAEGAAEAGAAGAAEAAGAGATTAATEAATTAGSEAFANGVASGMSEAEATAAANTAADASLASSAGVEPGAGLNALGNSGVGLNAGNASGIAATQSATEGVAGATQAVTQALPYTEAFDAANLAGQGLSQETIAQNLTANGLNDFMANDIAGLAKQGLDQDAINQALQYSYSSQELAPLHLESLQATVPEGVNVKDVITNANRARKLANLIMPNATGSVNVKPTAQQFAQFQSANQPAQQQIGGIYNMNQTPFLANPQNNVVPTSSAKPHDFLAELAQEGKPQPALADLLRNA